MKEGIREQHSEHGEVFRGQRFSWLGLSIELVAGLVGVMGLAFPATVFATAADPSPTIRIRVVDYASASPAILAEAEREAARILSKAGLRTVWVNCSGGRSTTVPQDPCQELEATDISLRVLSEPTQNTFQDTVFGFAVVPILATVYYEAVRHAKSDGAAFDTPIILGCVIAHEIGHLLLGSNSHSGLGVMKRRWERKQFRQAMTGILLFTPEQAKRIQAEAQTRMRLEATALELSAKSYAVLGTTPEQGALVRAQIRVMQPDVYPLRVFFAPHWKYIDTTRTFRLHVPAGYTSAMFTSHSDTPRAFTKVSLTNSASRASPWRALRVLHFYDRT